MKVESAVEDEYNGEISHNLRAGRAQANKDSSNPCLVSKLLDINLRLSFVVESSMHHSLTLLLSG